MRDWVTVLILILSLMVGPVAAVPLQPGQQYPGGTKLEVQAGGMAVVVPEGWFALQPHGSAMLVLTPDEQSDEQSYVMATAEVVTLDEVRAFLSNPLPLGNGVVLQPQGSPTQDGQDLVMPYAVKGGVEPYEASGRARWFSNGVVVVVFALAKAGELEPTRRVADQFLANVTIMEGSDDWQPYLKGRHLVRYHTVTGHTEERHIYLCADGHFRKTFRASNLSGTGSVVAASGHAGRWQAIGSGNVGWLILHFDDGRRSEFELEFRDNKMYLDGEQWLKDTNSYCP